MQIISSGKQALPARSQLNLGSQHVNAGGYSAVFQVHRLLVNRICRSKLGLRGFSSGLGGKRFQIKIGDYQYNRFARVLIIEFGCSYVFRTGASVVPGMQIEDWLAQGSAGVEDAEGTHYRGDAWRSRKTEGSQIDLLDRFRRPGGQVRQQIAEGAQAGASGGARVLVAEHQSQVVFQGAV